MPNNPAQPRDRDGRYGTVPVHVPTANTHPHQPAPVDDGTIPPQYEALFRRMLAARGIDPEIVFTEDPGNLAHRPDAIRPDEHEWATTYHKRFRHFHPRAVRATKILFRNRPSSMNPEDRKILFQNWVNEIADTYGMERPAFYWDDTADMGGGGFYRHDDHSITMSPNHPSVVTLIHETRHALQKKEKGAPLVTDDLERDARAWSLSLYYKVRPKLFKRLVKERRIFHIDPTIFDETPGSSGATSSTGSRP